MRFGNYRRPRGHTFHDSTNRRPVRLYLAAVLALVSVLCLTLAAVSFVRSARTKYQNDQYAQWRDTALTARAATLRLAVQRMGLPDGSVIPEDDMLDGSETDGDIVTKTIYHHITEQYLPEMAAMRQRNGDLAGWLRIPGILDLPVVYFNNEWYLTHDFEGGKNASGTLFLDEAHPVSERTQHLLIHGHNMKDGSMFGLMTHYLRADYLKQHPFLTFSTLWEKEEYVVFAVLRISPVPGDSGFFDYLSHPVFASDAAFEDYIAELRGRSLCRTYINVRPSDALLTLSTCVGSERLLIVARRIRMNESIQSLKEMV